ncbi:hypothetical protein [Emticicia sp. BO119]|uniref:hypothetical protein n=1 Tax=Emticicia sp. BO119 TaxID=2757768 RepID=UPI0015F0CDD9|nr:hypothetical protein [Emticicia sp. BO119]MBA4849483.1 hypothetical protein [Emticicia sp. BO119]
MEENKNSNANAIDSLASAASKGINAFRIQKELKLWLILAVVGGVIIFFIVRAIKKSALNDIPLPELPTGGDPIADPDTYKQDAEITAKSVKDVTEGWFTLASTKESVFRKLYAMSDRDLVYVYRVYSNLYYKKSQETMTAAIDSESNYIPEWQGGVKVKLVNRLNLLGAK